MKNAYTEKPILYYVRTSVEMPLVVSYLKSLSIPTEIKRAAYIFFRIESGNGRKGVNNNYAGIQADGARWPAVHDAKIIGTVIKKENVTGKERIFVAFESYTDSLDFTIENITRRGLYIGGTPFKFHKELINSPTDLMIAYKKEWVIGSSKYAVNESELKGFISMYRQSEIIFT